MKYKLLRNSKTDQRVWEGEDGNLYLADHSADSYRVGRPDETDDGPLKVLKPHELIANEGSEIIVLRFSVPVEEMRNGRHSRVTCGLGVAKFLSERLGIPMLVSADGVLARLHIEEGKPNA